MKLVEIVGMLIAEWPERVECMVQGSNGDIYPAGGRVSGDIVWPCVQLADDWILSEVTRAQWEAERARILLESQPERDPFIKELVDIACGNRSKEDQELWDKCFIESQSMIFENAADMEPLADIAYRVAAWSDAFMAERAKRMKG